MYAGRLAALAVVTIACNNPSPLDRVPVHAKHAPDDSGFDFAGTLAKIRDTVEKPGPYEAPAHSGGYDAGKPHWGVLALSGELVERESWSLVGGKGTELRAVTDRLRELAADPLVVGLVVRLGDLRASLPELVELRAAMHAFRAAKKQLRCHADSASNASYLVLAACDAIGLAPLGELAITGPVVAPIHVKGLLDKLGIQADFIHIGAYKGAAEPLTLDAPSDQMKETLGAILDQRYATMIDIIAADRHLDSATVKGLVDIGLLTGEHAKAAKLVDEVQPFEPFRDAHGAEWTRLELDVSPKDPLGSYVTFARFVGAMPAERPIADHVALVYAVGNIVDGGGEGVLGARKEIAERTLVAALHALGADHSVKAIVLRIDSGGGSALASEQIWRAVTDLDMPVVVSMGDVAASGGYYIASGATEIYALPDTLTGSIGVVGGRIAPAAALAKLGIATFPMGRGKHATMMASLAPWTPDERKLIEASMESVYEAFLVRVALGRHKTPAEVLAIASGRVWTGAKAKELGLVDKLGGLDDAIAEARKLGKVDPATELEVYPPAPTLRDVLHGFGGVEAPFGLHVATLASDVLAGVDPAIARVAMQLVDLVLTFRTTHVQTVAVLPGWSS